jgi:hypothetical protein
MSKSTDPRQKQARWMVDYRDPQNLRHRKYFTTKGQAAAHARLVNAKINAENYQSITSLAWDDMTQDFLKAKQAEKAKPATLKIYREVFTEFGDICQKPISTRITPQRLDLYKRHIQENSTPTINKKLRHLAALFNWAKNRKYMAENPVEVSGKLREPKRKPRTITIPPVPGRVAARSRLPGNHFPHRIAL